MKMKELLKKEMNVAIKIGRILTSVLLPKVKNSGTIQLPLWFFGIPLFNSKFVDVDSVV